MVIAIIAVLAALLLPTLGMVRAAAHASKCRSNQRQLALALEAYASDNEGLYPPTWQDPPNVPASCGYWLAAIAPLVLPDKTFSTPDVAANSLINRARLACPGYTKGTSGDNGYYGRNRQLLGVPGNPPPQASPLPRARFAASTVTYHLMDNSSVVAGTGSKFSELTGTTLRHRGRVMISFIDTHSESLPLATIADDNTLTTWRGE